MRVCLLVVAAWLLSCRWFGLHLLSKPASVDEAGPAFFLPAPLRTVQMAEDEHRPNRHSTYCPCVKNAERVPWDEGCAYKKDRKTIKRSQEGDRYGTSRRRPVAGQMV